MSATPFEVVRGDGPVLTADKPEVLRLVRRLEEEAIASPPSIGYGVLQDARLVTPRTLRVWTRLADAGAEVALLARDLHAATAPGLTCVQLADDDPLADEWCVVLDGPRPVVLAAVDLPYERWDGDRTFSYAVSRDPAVVGACAEAVLQRAAGLRRQASSA